MAQGITLMATGVQMGGLCLGSVFDLFLNHLFICSFVCVVGLLKDISMFRFKFVGRKLWDSSLSYFLRYFAPVLAISAEVAEVFRKHPCQTTPSRFERKLAGIFPNTNSSRQTRLKMMRCGIAPFRSYL